MKWLSELWGKSSTVAQVALVLAFVAVVGMLLYFLGSLDVLGGWLGTN